MKIKEGELLKEHVFIFNKGDNSGEHIRIKTKFYTNGDIGGFYINQEIILQSYCNNASINLIVNYLSPEQLRELANELDSCKAKLFSNG